MPVFPEIPPQLREFFPSFYWNWWQAFKAWLGKVTIDGLTIPTYANNAAAIAGGLAVGDFYRTAAGELMVVV